MDNNEPAIKQISTEFYQWVVEARQLVDAHFLNEMSSAHNHLILDAAKSMMMMHKLGNIEISIDDLRAALISLEEG